MLGRARTKQKLPELPESMIYDLKPFEYEEDDWEVRVYFRYGSGYISNVRVILAPEILECTVTDISLTLQDLSRVSIDKQDARMSKVFHSWDSYVPSCSLSPDRSTVSINYKPPRRILDHVGVTTITLSLLVDTSLLECVRSKSKP
jgi:hypothetical protein